MKLLTAALVGASLLGSGVATADGRDGDCPHVPKRPAPPRRPVTPRRPTDPPKPPPCACKGERGEAGPQGPAGPKGDNGQLILFVVTQEVQAEPSIKVAAGLMGFSSNPYGDWAWGPAISLSTRVNDNYDLRFNAGLAAGASDGRESGYLLSLTGERHLRKDLGGFLGVYRASIDGSPDNGNIDGDYLGLTAGISLSSRRFRFEIGPTLSGLRDDSRPGDTQVAVGGQAALFVRLGQ
jgi:hypothetical protein